MAQSAYLAVCLDLDKSLSRQYPKQWKQACFELSGYWRIMNNIFYGDSFISLNIFKDKFVTAGFKIPVRRFTDDELYSSVVVWKEPTEIYPK